jgi:predicted O-methyltransferase YrrM
MGRPRRKDLINENLALQEQHGNLIKKINSLEQDLSNWKLESSRIGNELDAKILEMEQMRKEHALLLTEKNDIKDKMCKFQDEKKWDIEILNQEIDKLKGQNPPAVQYFPPGHYYSTIPSLEDVHNFFTSRTGVDEILTGIANDGEDQMRVFRSFYEYYDTQPFSEQGKGKNRYYFDNNFFSYGDGLTLHFMMRRLHPKKIIEVGSGFSSAVVLDTNDQFFNGSIECSFIEPYSERLKSLLRPDEFVTLHEKRLQDIDLDIFSELGKNDILFIDSTHVSKFQSDVNHVFFHILPLLKRGVVVHIHDIFYPFEYPMSWFDIGIAWNEAYLLRAFLQYNNEYKIKLWGNYLWTQYKEEIIKNMPLYAKNPGGSIWLEKK